MQAAGRPFRSGGVRFTDGDEDIDLEDLFGGIFGGRGADRGHFQWALMPGYDQEIEAEVTVEEAYHGTQRSLTITGPDGQRTLDVNIPAGVVEGQRIRPGGQGGKGTGGGKPGDRPDHPDRPASPLPAVRPGFHAPLPLSPGGGARCRGPRRHAWRPRDHQRPTRHVQRSAKLRAEGSRLPKRRGEPGDFFADRSKCQLTVREERRLFEELAERSTFNPREQR